MTSEGLLCEYNAEVVLNWALAEQTSGSNLAIVVVVLNLGLS